MTKEYVKTEDLYIDADAETEHTIADDVSGVIIRNMGKNSVQVFLQTGADTYDTDAFTLLPLGKEQIAGNLSAIKIQANRGKAHVEVLELPVLSTNITVSAEKGEIIWKPCEKVVTNELSNNRTIWIPVTDYVFLTAADTLEIASSNSGDNTENHNILVEGLDGDYEPVTQTVNLNGTTKVSLGSLLRINRIANVGVELSGDVTITDSSGEVVGFLDKLRNLDHSSIFTVPAGKQGLIRAIYVDLINDGGALDSDSNIRVRGYVYNLVGDTRTAPMHIFSFGLLESRGSLALTSEYIQPIKAKSDIEFRVVMPSDDADPTIFLGYAIELIDE